jgi:hypothetical protein
MKLADFRLKRAFNRRQHEWKVTVGVWALLAAGIAHPPGNHPWIFLLATCLITLGHAFFRIKPHWVTSTIDFDTAFWFAEQAERTLPLAGSPDAGPRPLCSDQNPKSLGLRFLCASTCKAQMAATFLLGIAVVFRAAEHM